jgi:hypothetical protein
LKAPGSLDVKDVASDELFVLELIFLEIAAVAAFPKVKLPNEDKADAVLGGKTEPIMLLFLSEFAIP